MSKFPILQYENQDVSISGPERRGLLHCVLEMPDQRPNVHAICVHLGLLASHRRQQIDLLCEMASRDIPADAPLIVAGDFNDWRVQAHDQLAQGAGLHEVFVQSLGRAARTFPARAPLLRLDRIYVRNAVGHAPVVLPRQPWAHLSDHAPLAAEIELWRDSSADMARASRRTATDRLLKFPVAQGLPSRPVLDSWFYPRVFAHPRPRCAPTHDSCPNG